MGFGCLWLKAFYFQLFPHSSILSFYYKLKTTNFIVIANYVLLRHCEGAKRLRQSHTLLPTLFIFVFYPKTMN